MRHKHRLSPAQQKAMAKVDWQWRSAYELQCSLATLRALEKLGIVVSKSGLGAMAFPHTCIEWKLN